MDEFIKNQLVHDLLLELLRVDRIPDKCAWGTTYESIVFPEGYEKPPKEEFEAKLQELLDAQPLKQLRQERSRRIAQTDYLFTSDFPHATPEKKQEWFEYRQALRDLPTATEDPVNPVWPVRPDEVVAVVVKEETSNVVVEEETSNVVAVPTA